MIGVWVGVITGIFILAVIAMTRIYSIPQVPHSSTPEKFGLEFEEIWFKTANNCNLYGWWLEADNGGADPSPTIIMIHGWSRNLERMMDYIRNLHGQGFNLMAFDSRHHGSSDSDGFSSMLKFGQDVSAAVDYAILRPETDPEKIGVLGLSIGGAGAIYAAAHDDRIGAVVTVGAFSHPGAVMQIEFTRRKIPYFPFVWLLFKYMEIRIGAKLDQIAPVNNISSARAKILLVHGVMDKTVPVDHSDQLLRMSNKENTELWKIPERGHSDCRHEKGFWKKIISFYRDSLN